MPDRKLLNIGTVANDGTGDTLRDAADKIEFNFGQLYEQYTSSSLGVSGNSPLSEGTVVLTSASPTTVAVPDGTDVGQRLTFINTALTTVTFTGTHLGVSEVYMYTQGAVVFVWSGTHWAVVSGV